VCRAAKSLERPPIMLMTATDVEQVPDALDAGCDSVLVKPFSPGLLLARLGRLARGHMLRPQPKTSTVRFAPRRERSALLLGGTNRLCPNTHCPYYQHAGVTSSDQCAYQRAWYACLACRKVWIAAGRD
jgi:DNA-binding response OmpR family regulator